MEGDKKKLGFLSVVMSVPGLSAVKHPVGNLLFASIAMASAKETPSGLSIALYPILSVPASHMVLVLGCRLRPVSHHSSRICAPSGDGSSKDTDDEVARVNHVN
jgi:hypothetical protein